MAKLHDEHIGETATEAQGAERWRTIPNVLLAGIVLVVAAFLVVYYAHFGV